MSLERIQGLRESLHDHNFRYYVLDETIISDFEFDKLLLELKELENIFPEVFDPNSPTQKVGGQVIKSFNTCLHKRPMLSLSNSYNKNDITSFIHRSEMAAGQKIDWSVELKYDGVAISLCYEDRKLVRAVTRGDGLNGDDVSVNVRTIKNIPLTLPSSAPNELEVRGEVYFTFSSFEKLNEQRLLSGQNKFANPRNAASGSLKLQDSAEVSRRNLSALMYSVYSEHLDFKTHSDSLSCIQSWGFPLPNKETGWAKLCYSIDDILDYLALWDKQRHDLPFGIDGAVIKINDIGLQEKLGFSAKSPRWAIAYKFDSEMVLTILRDVKYQIGRTGAITPVAILDPIWISGTVVRRASIHNADQISKLDLHIGDSVYIEKGGEIIPKIISVDFSKRQSDAIQIKFISHCPDCAELLTRRAGDAQHYCQNTERCKTQIKGRLEHFIHRKAMNIDGIGSETIDQLVELGLVFKPSQLYNLQVVGWQSLKKFKDKSIQNVIAGMKESKSVSFERVLFSLGIRHVGATVAKKIARHFEDIDAIINSSEEELLEIETIGPMIAKSMHAYFSDESALSEIQKLKDLGLNFYQKKEDSESNNLSGKTFVVSGVFDFYTRDGIKTAIEQNGGKILSSVSPKTDYLITGKGVGPSKLKKAIIFEIELLTENEFRIWIGSTH